MKISRHNDEIQRNLHSWEKKPILRKIYEEFHALIAQHLIFLPHGHVVELGSGIGNIKTVVPHCIRTDLFPNPWIDRVENAYHLSFPDASISDLILFDVFHHLRYPGTALNEFGRVLLPKGRIIIFDPCLSILGLLVWGLLHHEPLGRKEPIDWFAPDGWAPENIDYYAASANASRVFDGKEFEHRLGQWRIIAKRKFSAISYVATGGYSKLQLYPDSLYPLMRALDRGCDRLPFLFATRLLVVLEKQEAPSNHLS
jgi:SAM-dependent methyltransferase